MSCFYSSPSHQLTAKTTGTKKTKQEGRACICVCLSVCMILHVPECLGDFACESLCACVYEQSCMCISVRLRVCTTLHVHLHVPACLHDLACVSGDTKWSSHLHYVPCVSGGSKAISHQQTVYIRSCVFNRIERNLIKTFFCSDSLCVRVCIFMTNATSLVVRWTKNSNRKKRKQGKNCQHWNTTFIQKWRR